MNIRRLQLGLIQTNCYIIEGGAIVIDPADRPDLILSKLSSQLKHIILTHLHWDHTGAAEVLRQKTGALIYAGSGINPDLSAGRGDEPEIDCAVSEGDVIKADETELKVIRTPGHTPEGISLYDGAEVLFSGDTLFRSSAGRTDLPGGDRSELVSSLRKLMELPGSVRVLPGHGPETTVDYERKNNPFI